MFDSFTRPGSFTTSARAAKENLSTGKDKLEEKHVNCEDMASRRSHLDSLVAVLDKHIDSRLHSTGTEVRLNSRLDYTTLICSMLRHT